MSEKKINWGIIGCGDVCEVKSGPAFNKVPDSKLVAVMRRNAEKAADYAKRHGVPKSYSDADKLINDSEVNAIYIATPPGSHKEYTLKAAKAGKPIYVEKPMAVNHQECEDMVAACEAAGVPLFVAYYRRCLPYFSKVKSILDSGEIGKVRMVNIKLYQAPKPADLENDSENWRVDPALAGGGYFYDLASHQFDFLDYFFGPIASVAGQQANFGGYYKVEDTVTAQFQFENGIIGTGNWCFVTSPEEEIDVVEIIGEKGGIHFSSFNLDIPVTLLKNGKKETYDHPKPAHVHQPLIEKVVEELTGKGKSPSTGVSGARTNWVLEKIVSY
ncbi:Gfo/Idh/MocA family protein [Flexithrix dorotheae]|uniref:Gfo/Idh/MocA family protein n=1 Tax=Flexithrix dorotheae TaxID=70993 RepID=UPI00036F7505|nr:Gfo/Idh/MocA family oxidoreductase [Flexithrix dorotheae]